MAHDNMILKHLVSDSIWIMIFSKVLKLFVNWPSPWNWKTRKWVNFPDSNNIVVVTLLNCQAIENHHHIHNQRKKMSIFFKEEVINCINLVLTNRTNLHCKEKSDYGKEINSFNFFFLQNSNIVNFKLNSMCIKNIARKRCMKWYSISSRKIRQMNVLLITECGKVL